MRLERQPRLRHAPQPQPDAATHAVDLHDIACKLRVGQAKVNVLVLLCPAQLAEQGNHLVRRARPARRACVRRLCRFHVAARCEAEPQGLQVRAEAEDVVLEGVEGGFDELEARGGADGERGDA